MFTSYWTDLSIFVLDRPASIGTDNIFRHGFRNREGLEHSDYKTDTRQKG